MLRRTTRAVGRCLSPFFFGPLEPLKFPAFSFWPGGGVSVICWFALCLLNTFLLKKRLAMGFSFLKTMELFKEKKSRDLVMVIISMRMFIINEDATLYPPWAFTTNVQRLWTYPLQERNTNTNNAISKQNTWLCIYTLNLFSRLLFFIFLFSFMNTRIWIFKFK